MSWERINWIAPPVGLTGGVGLATASGTKDATNASGLTLVDYFTVFFFFKDIGNSLGCVLRFLLGQVGCILFPSLFVPVIGNANWGVSDCGAR